jgi:chorismate synthase
MAGNKFGSLFSIMTFGESHGPYIGVVIDGITPGIPIDIGEIQKEMNRRRPGQSKLTTPRDEKDRAEIISGIFEGKTTGTPICILIKNEDQRSKDYSKLKDIFRPGHAAYTYLKKYGIFDYRGGGRASGRETATRVAAGALAKQVLKEYGIEFRAFTRRIGPIEAQETRYDFIEQNPVRCGDPEAARKMEDYIREIAEEGDSIGGVVELHIRGLPAGLGDPVFEKLDAELAHGLMSIGAVKGIEFGAGFRVAEIRGSENNDVFHVNEKGDVVPETNHAGGILGGISTGRDVVLRLAVKPPSSIKKPQQTVDRFGNDFSLSVEGRHDPCICPRVVPVAEAMAALVILDLLLTQRAISAQKGTDNMLKKEIQTINTQLLLLLKKRLQLAGKLNRTRRRADKKNKAPEVESLLSPTLREPARELGIKEDTLKRIWGAIREAVYQEDEVTRNGK